MEVTAHIFFPKPEASHAQPGAAVPPIFHVIYISAMILPMIVGFLSTHTDKRWFKGATLVYAALLTLLNVFHFVEQIAHNVADVSQVILLLYVAVANVFLVVWINNWRKQAS